MELARLYHAALEDPFGEDLRWCILANLAVWGQSERSIYPSLDHKKKIQVRCVSPDWEYVATATSDGTLHLWEVGTGKLLAKRRMSERSIFHLCFSPDGETILAEAGRIAVDEGLDEKSTICTLWRTPSLDLIGTLLPPKASSSTLAGMDHDHGSSFSPHGGYVATQVSLPRSGPATVSTQRRLVLWDARTGQQRLEIPPRADIDSPGRTEYICWSPDETKLALESASAVYEIPSGRFLYELPREARVPVMGNFIGFHVDMKGLEFALSLSSRDFNPVSTHGRWATHGRLSEFADERLGQRRKPSSARQVISSSPKCIC